MTAPFGIELNAPLSGAEILQDIGGNKMVVSPAKAHPMFTEYYVQVSPTYGVVWVKGVGPIIDNDASGFGAQDRISKLSGQLALKYGAPRKVDILQHGAIWEESRDWVMSLLQQERSYFHIWEAGKSAQLPEDIETLFLGVTAYSSSESSTFVEYASSNLKEAEKEIDADLSDLL